MNTENWIKRRSLKYESNMHSDSEKVVPIFFHHEVPFFSWSGEEGKTGYDWFNAYLSVQNQKILIFLTSQWQAGEGYSAEEKTENLISVKEFVEICKQYKLLPEVFLALLSDDVVSEFESDSEK